MARSGFDRQVIERYVRPHLLALSVAGPSVISPAFSPPGARFNALPPSPGSATTANSLPPATEPLQTTQPARLRSAEHSMFQRLFMQLLCDFCRSFWVGDYMRFSVLGCQG